MRCSALHYNSLFDNGQCSPHLCVRCGSVADFDAPDLGGGCANELGNQSDFLVVAGLHWSEGEERRGEERL